MGVVGDGGGSTPDFLTTFWGVEIVLLSLACLASTFSLLSAVDYLSMVYLLRSSHKMNKCAGVLNCAPQLQSDCHIRIPFQKPQLFELDITNASA